MKNNRILSLAVLLFASVLISACGGLPKMIKNKDQVNINVNPNPLEMHADSIAIDLSAKIPPKFFHKKVQLEATPVLRYNGGETEFDKIFLKGEKLTEGKGTTIPYSAGGSASLKGKIPFQPEMREATLVLVIKGRQGKKEGEFEYELAKGTITTPQLLQSDDMPILGAHQYKKSFPLSYNATLNFDKGRSILRPSELKDQDIKNLEGKLNKELMEKEDINITGVRIDAYASPEGEQDLNANLSEDRGNTAKNYVQKQLVKAGVSNAKDDNFITAEAHGEDWDGFKKKVSETDISEKQTILDILNKHVNLDEREKAIRSLTAIYPSELEDKVLPHQRRADITVKGEVKSRDEVTIKLLMLSKPDTLRQEELLYGGTLIEDLNDQAKVYKSYTELFKDDWRGYNNLACVYIKQNKMNEAKDLLNKAQEMASDEPVVKNNIGVIERIQGNPDKAMELYEQATAAGSKVNYNMGIVHIKRADYSSAVSNMGDFNTYNAALAKLLAGDAAAAMNTLDESEAKNSAEGKYLKAIAAARKDNKELVISSLKEAVNLDASLKQRAASDLEFAKYMDDEAFKAAIQ